MFRILLVIFVLAFSVTKTVAQDDNPSRILDKVALREAIYAGDIDLVEEVMATAHAMYQAKDANPGDLRVIFQLFTTTNPAIIDFTKRWLNEKPESLYAHTAQAWIDFTASWNIRGERLARQTYPYAMSEFRRLQDSAWDHAWIAFEISPDFVPASDALLRTAAQTGQVYDGLEVIDIVMKQRPDKGSLDRAIGMTDPGWSAANWDSAAWLCSTYAPMIEWDLAEDPETHCLVQAAMTTHGATHDEWGYQMLLAGRAPSLDHLRLHRATYSRATRAEAEFARRHLSLPGVSTYYYARRFDENIATRYGFEFISYEHLLRQQEIARAQLEHDPYDPGLIKILLTRGGKWQRKENGEIKILNMPSLSNDERKDLIQRLLISSPFDPDHWYDLLGVVGQGLLPETFQNFDDYFINSVVYSNHSPNGIARYLHNKAEAYLRLDFTEKGKMGPEWQVALDHANWANDVICPMIRLYRLRNLVCETTKDSSCKSSAEFEDLFQSTLRSAERDGICVGERTEDAHNLFFSPVPVDFHDFSPPTPG